MATTSLLRRCAPYLLSSLLLVLQILATAATMTPSGIPEKLFPASLDPFLTNHFVPKSGLMKHRNGKNGVLAINLRANEEPEFVGVLWLKSHRAVNVLERSGMRLNEVEEQVPSLIDIQQVIHRQPVPGPYRTVRTVGSSDSLD
ncbi:uncharacterized protein UDID_18804 [Ustilago sp. UG-2017a]|nr:uncharacterized protein UDID_18804 [Ustilago sp. UG-2017a]